MCSTRPRHVGCETERIRPDGAAIVELAQTELYDVIILPLPGESPTNPLGQLDARGHHIVRHAHCRVLLATAPVIPDEVVDRTPSAHQ